jgi:glycosyltransferase involved in cell wall biosynthesis
MASLYRGATALVFPSLIEGFGLPVLEAMACGTAVITSHCSSLPEVAGDAAIYVESEQVAEIAAAMRAVATQPELRAELVSRGLARSRQFSPERAARQTIAVYQLLAADRQARQATRTGGAHA